MPLKILAVDDSATMRKVLEMTFAGEDGVEVESVATGEAAVERAAALTPDLVIADASMSMDGYEVARALKTNPATSSCAVIVLASQHAPYDPAKGGDAGVDDHIVKPYDSQAMIDKAKEVLGKPRNKATGGPVAVAASPRPPSPPSPPTPASTRPSGAGRPPRSSPTPSPRSTVAFGAVQPKRPALELAEEPAKPAQPKVPSIPRTSPKPARPAASASPAKATASASRAAAAATSGGSDLASKLGDLGLSADQLEGVLALSREVIERVVWEVVPDLAEVIIREEIKRLTD